MPRSSVLWVVLLAACQSGSAPPSRSQRVDALAGARLSLDGPPGMDETDQRPVHRVVLARPGAEALVVTEAAIDAALAPEGQVAWLDAEGLHVLVAGQARRVSRAAPHGLAVNERGVLFTSAAERGSGSGLAFATWTGDVRTLVAPLEELPGPSGYHHPMLSPDGRYALAFSDLTPRPSLWRVTLATGELLQLVADMPGASEKPVWEEGRLRWSDGEGQVVRVDPASGALDVSAEAR